MVVGSSPTGCTIFFMSQILSIPQMLALEARVFAGGIDPWELMQAVGQGMARAIQQRFPEPGTARIFVGKGNNGGDAWVVADHLAANDWIVEVVESFKDAECSALALRAKEQWSQKHAGMDGADHFKSSAPRRLVLIDGLLGIGSRGEPREPVARWIEVINNLRKKGAYVFALDLPSGLGGGNPVIADHTLTAGFAKDLLLTDGAASAVGRLQVIAVEAFGDSVTPSPLGTVNTPASLNQFVPPRLFDTHKGQCGRLAIIAGGVGTAGAAVLAATGALRAGAGLVTVFVPDAIYPIVASKAPPEAMVLPWTKLPHHFHNKWDAFAIGPGVHPAEASGLESLLTIAAPKVLDAGLLTFLAQRKDLLDRLEANNLLTPHPGEMERLFSRAGRNRREWAEAFLIGKKCTLLLKGSRTLVMEPGRPPGYNPTGHPGMATGGMGDVLTGVCGALLAQGLAPHATGCVAAWVCGRAAELAVERQGRSQESLLPSDLFDFFGPAFDELRTGH